MTMHSKCLISPTGSTDVFQFIYQVTHKSVTFQTLESAATGTNSSFFDPKFQNALRGDNQPSLT